MATTLDRFVAPTNGTEPTRYQPMGGGGGSRFGVHYLSEFLTCPMRWFLRYGYPAGPAGEPTGLASYHTGAPLLVGSAYHAGIEEWYRSGWRDGADTGERSLDAAVARVEADFTSRASEWADPDTAHEAQAETIAMVRRYHSLYGINGTAPEYPGLRVLPTEAGEPCLEVEYEFPIGPTHTMTARIDGLVSYHGVTMVHERKTSSSLSNTVAAYTLHAQPLALLTLVNHHFAEPVAAILLDVANKRYGPRSKQPPFLRTPLSHPHELIGQFAQVARDALDGIDHYMGAWKIRVAGGQEPLEAAYRTFPMRGLFDGACYSFGRECDFARLCRSPGTAGGLVQTYRPRVGVSEGVEGDD